MAIRWDEFPHDEIRLKIYTRLSQNAVGRSAEDSLRHILRRRLSTLDPEDHRRFVELEARNLVEHLRCTRDVYREFVEKHNSRPVLEAQWVILRLAVFPTAIALLREQVVNYAKLTRIPGRDLSILFGILTRTCYQDIDGVGGMKLIKAPDLDDDTAATDSELESLGKLVNEDSLLFFRDIHEGGGVWPPFGGGPFAIDDQSGYSQQLQSVRIESRSHASRMGKAKAGLVPESTLDRRLMQFVRVWPGRVAFPMACAAVR